MRVLTLIKNHPWNVQALVTKEEKDKFNVLIQPINGPDYGLDKTTCFKTEKEAFDHAQLVVMGEV